MQGLPLCSILRWYWCRSAMKIEATPSHLVSPFALEAFTWTRMSAFLMAVLLALTLAVFGDLVFVWLPSSFFFVQSTTVVENWAVFFARESWGLSEVMEVLRVGLFTESGYFMMKNIEQYTVYRVVERSSLKMILKISKEFNRYRRIS